MKRRMPIAAPDAQWVLEFLLAGHKKARPALEADRAVMLNYLDECVIGAGAGAGGLGQQEAASAETAAAAIRNLAVFMLYNRLLVVGLHRSDVRMTEKD